MDIQRFHARRIPNKLAVDSQGCYWLPIIAPHFCVNGTVSSLQAEHLHSSAPECMLIQTQYSCSYVPWTAVEGEEAVVSRSVGGDVYRHQAYEPWGASSEGSSATVSAGAVFFTLSSLHVEISTKSMNTHLSAYVHSDPSSRIFFSRLSAFCPPFSRYRISLYHRSSSKSIQPFLSPTHIQQQ